MCWNKVRVYLRGLYSNSKWSCYLNSISKGRKKIFINNFKFSNTIVYRKGYRGTRVFRVRGDNKIIRGKPKKIEINLYKNDRTSTYMPILYVHWLLACVCRLGWLIRQAQQPRLTGGGVVEWLRRRSRVFVNICTWEYKTRRPVCLCAFTLHSLLSIGLEHWTAVFRHRSEWLSRYEWLSRCTPLYARLFRFPVFSPLQFALDWFLARNSSQQNNG